MRKVAGWVHPPNNRLAEHILAYYWRGDLALDSELLKKFWNLAPPDLRANAIAFVGRSLDHTEGDIDRIVLERLQALWEWRLSTIQGEKTKGPFTDELSMFGSWFASGKLEGDWSLRQLRAVLDIVGEIEASHLVVSRLAQLSGVFPVESVTLLAKLVEGDKKGWAPELWHERARDLLQHALTSNNAEAQRLAEQLINDLGVRGYLGYLDLLRTKN
jgi:hypothetical protein